MSLCDWPLCQALALLIPPYVVQFWEEKAKSYGPIASGALFGAGWWFWVDAVVCTAHKIPFDQVRLTAKRICSNAENRMVLYVY